MRNRIGPVKALRLLVIGNLGRLLILRSELDLSDEQLAQIDQARARHRAELAKTLTELVKRRRALREAVVAEPADPSAIRLRASEVGQCSGDTAVMMAQVVREVRGILTPEQQGRVRATRDAIEATVDGFLREAAQRGS